MDSILKKFKSEGDLRHGQFAENEKESVKSDKSYASMVAHTVSSNTQQNITETSGKPPMPPRPERFSQKILLQVQVNASNEAADRTNQFNKSENVQQSISQRPEKLSQERISTFEKQPSSKLSGVTVEKAVKDIDKNIDKGR